MKWGRERTQQLARAPFDSDAAFALQRDIAGALTRAVAPGVYRPGGVLMRGKAAKHLGLLGRTLLVRADPVQVAGVVAPAVADAKTKFAPVTDLERGDVAAWEAESIFGPVPRFVVRASPLLRGVTEIGTLRFAMSMRFPQGGVFTSRAVTAAAEALGAAGLTAVEQQRQFAPDPALAPSGVDGIWVAGPLVAGATVE